MVQIAKYIMKNILVVKYPKSYIIVALLLFTSLSFAQKVTSSIDSTSIKIGEELIYKIEVEADTTSLVVFPEGQSFLPLEMIESYDLDSQLVQDRFRLIKKYGLTQFDSGSYFIPRQKVRIGDYDYLTDSLQVVVSDVMVDTTKQKLYDIKPITEVDKSPSKWWLYVLLALLIIGIVAFLLYWFIWREKPLTKEEKIALLPPYERAKMALQQLDQAQYLEKDEVKAYYSELTLIIRKYLDEKVYDHSLESTTEELINRLQLLKDANQIDLDKGVIKNIETILRRADLVKFAKSKPDKELAKLDRNTIDVEIDHVKESLPEPTEEDLLADQKYQEELARKKKRKRTILTTIIITFLILGTFAGFTIHYGFDYVKDSIFGHPTKELLESNDWITSEYGAPGVFITTPEVLERRLVELPEEQKENMKTVLFEYGSIKDPFYAMVINTKYNPEIVSEDGVDLNQAIDDNLKSWEDKGVSNIITRNDKFTTPNGQEGVKTFGTADFPTSDPEEFQKGNYTILSFTTENILNQIIMVSREDDVYAGQIVDRVINSIELLKPEENEENN